MNKYLILSSFLVLSFILTGNANAAEHAISGDVVSCPNTESVYQLGDDNERWIFPDARTYYSWYSKLNPVEVTCEKLSSYRITGNITIQPGTFIVKSESSPKVYAIEPGGVLRWIRTAEDAVKLYGISWENRIHAMPDGQWPNYKMGVDLVSGEIPEGTIVFDLNRPGTEESEFYYYSDGMYNITSRIDEVLNDRPSKVINPDPLVKKTMTDNFWSLIKKLTWRR